MEKEMLRVMYEILFQLHVVTSQNFVAMSLTEGEDPVSAKTREYGLKGLAQEESWMNEWLKGRDSGCFTGTGSSSDS